MRTIFILTFILLITACSSTKRSGRVYESKKNDTLEIIATKFLKEQDWNRSQYQTLLIHWNPHVLEWNSLPKGTPIFLTRPLSPHVMEYENAVTFLDE